MLPARRKKVKARSEALAAWPFLLETINAAVSLNSTMVACGQLKLATTSLTDSHHELRMI
jgi:hypothetical protein